MITYLPEIYPDELVYSWFCRYYVHSGYLTNTAALKEILYNRCNNPSKEFLGHLNPEMLKAIQRMYPIEDIIINHTMYPQYARFIPLEQKKRALHHIAYDFCDAHHLFAILPRTESDRYLKYCPMCAAEDRQQFGEAFWHRLHQLRNMQICPLHSCMLIDSSVPAKSEKSFTFYPAEQYITRSQAQTVYPSPSLSFAKYMSDVFVSPLDFENDIPISTVFYNVMLNSRYMKSTRQTRYTQKLSEDLEKFYKKIGIVNTASIYQIQRILLGNRYDSSVICQLAFYLDMSLSDLIFPNITKEQIEQEQSTHTWRNQQPIEWEALDDETVITLEKIAKEIYTGTLTQRPERVSENIIYRELGLPAHRLDNLPKCKAVYEKYRESYEENWARRIIWAYIKLQKKGKPFYWSDIRHLSGVKKTNIEKIMPYIIKHTDSITANKIMDLIF